MKNKLPYCNLQIVFRTKGELINFFSFKYKTPVFSRFRIAYKCECGGSIATYHGKTKCYFKVTMCKHLIVSALTKWRAEGDNNCVKNEDYLFTNYLYGF